MIRAPFSPDPSCNRACSSTPKKSANAKNASNPANAKKSSASNPKSNDWSRKSTNSEAVNPTVADSMEPPGRRDISKVHMIDDIDAREMMETKRRTTWRKLSADERSLKTAMLVVVCLMLSGCEYTVPLVKIPEIAIDQSLLGLWERSLDDGQTENLLILPLNEREYMVSFPAGSKGAMFARGCLWRDADMTLVQLDWFGTAQAKRPDDNRTLQFVTYTVEGDQVTIRLLNANVVQKEITSSEELAKAITMNETKPNLFRKAMVFTKVSN